ncbi:unnamed protein product [Sphenostylis stenocarpa]|uniref:FAS1 domain-containing protein n=1 Tax=Sphenostylis stenocarpa TaxID=92480 RepID=A0AA87B961_9FABA|nr:unnamed protein product [Sphenostylis stenocarpa]
MGEGEKFAWGSATTTELSKGTFHLTQTKQTPLTLSAFHIFSSLHHPHIKLSLQGPLFLSLHHPHFSQQKMVIMKHSLSSLTLPLLLILLFSHHTSLAQSPAAAPTAPTTATTATAPAPVPSSPPTDIIRILKKAGGFTTLIRLLQATQVSNQINSQLLTSNGGLTLFAPNDNAFSSLKPGFLNSLNDQQKNELIQFHLLPTFVSVSNFDTLSNPVRTQAGENPDRLALNITSSGGNQVNMTTGIVNVTLGGTVYTDHQLAVYQVDKVLLPRDFFVAKPPAPAPAPEKPKGSKKKSADSTSTPADDAESAAISVKQQRVMWVAVTSLVVAAFSW